MKNALSYKTVQIVLTVFILCLPIAFIFLQDHHLLSEWEFLPTAMILGTLCIGLVFFILDQRSLMMLSFSACAALCVSLKEQASILPGMADNTPGNSIKIAHLKFSPENIPATQLLQLISETNVDVLSLQDIPLEDYQKIKTKLHWAGYQHSYKVDAPCQSYGIALFSIYPISFATGAPYFGSPNIIGKLQLPFRIENSNELFFVSTYIEDNKIYSQQEAALFKKELHYLAGQFNQMNAPLIVFGEYNAFSLRSEISNFRRNARLIDSHQNFSYLYPLHSFSEDDKVVSHIFYSNELKCVSFERINHLSYHHSGLIGTYEFVGKDTSSNDKQTSQEL